MYIKTMIYSYVYIYFLKAQPFKKHIPLHEPKFPEARLKRAILNFTT